MWPGRNKSLLSGEEIINFKQNSLKDIPAGTKDYAPDNSWLEQKQIQATLETHHILVGAQRIEKKSNLSTAQWLSTVGKAKVTKKAGKHWEVFGHTINSEDWLLPEEALFLLETNSLELYLQEVPLSVEQTYALIIGDYVSLSEYRVYSHLSRKGYRVLRHDKEISMTAYEKDIHVDQVGLAAKRSKPGIPTQQASPKNVVLNEEIQSVVPEDVSIPKNSSVNAASGEQVGGLLTVGPKDALYTEPSVSSSKVLGSVASKNTLSTIDSVSSKDSLGTEPSVSSSEVLGSVASKDTGSTIDSASSNDSLGTEPSVSSSKVLGSVASKDALNTIDSVSSRDSLGTEVPVSSNDTLGLSPTSSNDTSGVVVSISSKDTLSTIDSVSSKDSLGTEVPVSSNDTLSLSPTWSSNDTSGIVMSVSSKDAEPSQKDINSETDSIPTMETSASQNKLSVPQPSSQVDLVPHVSPPISKLDSEAQILVSKVREFFSLESEGSVGDPAASDCNVIIEEPDENVEPRKRPNEKLEDFMDIDDSSSEEAFPDPSSSPDLMIVEANDQVIEIEDDVSQSEDEDEVIITEVRKPNMNMDTVELLDSDEDDDVVFICQQPTNSDPSKWRKWFLTTTEFVNLKFQETPEESIKIPKVKLIDLFDLGQKSVDAIWKTIPMFYSNDEFINSPDQRFIPLTILPKCSHYKLCLDQRDVSPQSENRTPMNIDTSHNLNEIVQYGREPSNFNRNESYSFHRFRNFNQYAPRFNWNAARPPRNEMFSQDHQTSHYNNGYQGSSFPSHSQNGYQGSSFPSHSQNGHQGSSFPSHSQNGYQGSSFPSHSQNGYQGSNFPSHSQTNDQTQNHQQISSSNQNQNYNRNRFGNYNQNQHFGNFDNQRSSDSRIYGANTRDSRSFAPSATAQNPANYPPAQGNFGSNQFGNVLNQLGVGSNEALKVAAMQAAQMQLYAMGLMQSCQALIQQVPGFMPPINNMLGSNLFGNFNQQPQQQFQHRGHRPYRRPWRGGQGRRRYYNDIRNPRGPLELSSRVTEIPVSPNRENRVNEKSNVVPIGFYNEDKKVKPVIKRSMALNAIASLNKPKKAKLKIKTEVKSIKLDTSWPSTSDIIDLDDESSVKSESPRASPKLRDVSKRTEKRVPDLSPLARAKAVATPRTRQVVQNVPDRPKESVPEERAHARPDDDVEVHPVVDISDDSRPSYMVYDEQVSVDSDSFGLISEKSPDAVARSANSPKPAPVEAMDSSDAVLVSETVEDTDPLPAPTKNTEAGSWKTFKEQEQSLGDVEPKDSGPLAMYNERTDIKDYMKSLQVIGPIDDTEAPRDELRVLYDVYLPNQPFRKSLRLLPNYRVIIAKSESFPTTFELNYLESTYRDKVPFLYAVVTLDAIRLYNLRSVSLPTLIPDV